MQIDQHWYSNRGDGLGLKAMQPQRISFFFFLCFGDDKKEAIYSVDN